MPVLASFAVTFVAAAPGAAAHWLLTIAAGLPVGQYVADGRFMKAGQVVQITGPAWIMITESVSG